MDQSSRCYFQTSNWFYVEFSAFFSKLLLNNGTLYCNVDSASSAQITRQKSLPNFCIYNSLIALIKPRSFRGFILLAGNSRKSWNTTQHDYFSTSSSSVAVAHSVIIVSIFCIPKYMNLASNIFETKPKSGYTPWTITI